MNDKLELKLQSYLDNELSASDRREVDGWLAKDREWKSLFAELQNTRQALHGNEPEVRLPETREFFWSKIQREIARLENTAVRPAEQKLPWWRLVSAGRLARVAALAAVALLGVFLFRHEEVETFSQVHEVDTPSAEMGSITFRSEAEKMTVVYLYDREPAPELTGKIESADQ